MNESRSDSGEVSAVGTGDTAIIASLRVLLLTQESGKWTGLCAALAVHGVEPVVVGSLAVASAQPAPTVLLLDSDMPAGNWTFPFIVISSAPAGDADRSRMEQAVALGAFCYASAPINAFNLIANIRAAAHHAGRFDHMAKRAESLAENLKQDQAASTAIGILMERYNLTHGQAWDKLRGYSRGQRRRVSDVALQITTVANEFGALLDAVVSPRP